MNVSENKERTYNFGFLVSLYSMIEFPVATGDCNLRLFGLSSSSTSMTECLILFRFSDPRPVVGMLLEGMMSMICQWHVQWESKDCIVKHTSAIKGSALSISVSPTSEVSINDSSLDMKSVLSGSEGSYTAVVSTMDFFSGWLDCCPCRWGQCFLIRVPNSLCRSAAIGACIFSTFFLCWPWWSSES